MDNHEKLSINELVELYNEKIIPFNQKLDEMGQREKNNEEINITEIFGLFTEGRELEQLELSIARKRGNTIRRRKRFGYTVRKRRNLQGIKKMKPLTEILL